jgi:hypothetical protein
MTQTAAPTASELVTNLLDALSKDVEAAQLWGWVPISFIKHAWLKLRHLARRYASILVRYHAGTLPAPAAEHRRRPSPIPPPLVGYGCYTSLQRLANRAKP